MKSLLAIAPLLLFACASPDSRQTSVSSVSVEIDCADTAWQGSLFCLSSVGSTVAYTRPIDDDTLGHDFSARMLYTHGSTVWDPSTDLRCVDGTEPFYYISSDQAAQSDDWLFSFRGGGACHANGVASQQKNCDSLYLDAHGERPEMTSHSYPRLGMGVYNPRTQSFGGVLDPNLVKNPSFAGFNRIRPSKCSYDRFLGQMSSPAIIPGAGALVRQQGHLIIQKMLEDLADGVDFEDCSSGSCVGASLPQLCQANVPQRFVFAGHSAGAHSLIHAVDSLVDLLRTIPGCDDAEDQFFVVLDAHFLPMVENECRYNNSCSCPEQDIFCHTPSGSRGAVSWDDDVYQQASGSPTTQEYLDVQARLDASCLASHPLDPSPCADRGHVIANHLGTPFFARESLQDSGPEHCSGGSHKIFWANTTGGWNDINWDETTIPQIGCNPGLSPYSLRVTQAALDIVDDGRYATGCEGGLTSQRHFYLPDCFNHSAVFSNEIYQTSIGGYTHYDALTDFVFSSTSAVITSGLIGTSSCAP